MRFSIKLGRGNGRLALYLHHPQSLLPQAVRRGKCLWVSRRWFGRCGWVPRGQIGIEKPIGLNIQSCEDAWISELVNILVGYIGSSLSVLHLISCMLCWFILEWENIFRHYWLLLRKHVLENKFLQDDYSYTSTGQVPIGASKHGRALQMARGFLALLSYHCGERYVKKRLNAWIWDVGTSFNDVGCPEHVPSSFIIGCYVLFCFVWEPTRKKKTNPFKCLWTLPNIDSRQSRVSNAVALKLWTRRTRNLSGSSKHLSGTNHASWCFPKPMGYVALMTSTRTLVCCTYGKMCSPRFKEECLIILKIALLLLK